MPTSGSLGAIKFRYEWNWEEAEREFLRAIEINPSLGIAHHDYAWFLVAMEGSTKALNT
jgi:tetratricopeptide (TPR) repeat protein